MLPAGTDLVSEIAPMPEEAKNVAREGK